MHLPLPPHHSRWACHCPLSWYTNVHVEYNFLKNLDAWQKQKLRLLNAGHQDSLKLNCSDYLNCLLLKLDCSQKLHPHKLAKGSMWRILNTDHQYLNAEELHDNQRQDIFSHLKSVFNLYQDYLLYPQNSAQHNSQRCEVRRSWSQQTTQSRCTVLSALKWLTALRMPRPVGLDRNHGRRRLMRLIFTFSSIRT